MIHANRTEIRSILSAGDYYIEVPPNQRAFEWGREQVEELVDDLKRMQAAQGNHLFLGTFVFHEKEDRLSVIDGQQRITTMAIILIACREVSRKIGNHKLAAKIQEKLTFTDDTTGESKGARILAPRSIRALFDIMSDDGWDGSFPDKLAGVDGRTLRAQRNKLRSVYDYVSSQIKNYGSDELSQFLEALYSAYVVRIDIDDESDAFDIFERTNARGLELNAADLTKNYLFQSVDDEKLEENWSQVVTNAQGNVLRMLKYYWVSCRGPVLQSDLYKKLRARGQEIGAGVMLSEISDFSRFFFVALSADPSDERDWLRDIGCNQIASDDSRFPKITNVFWALRLFKVTQAYPVIYSAISSYARSEKGAAETELLLDLLGSIERYHFINSAVCERPGNEVEKFYGTFAARFSIGLDDFRECATSFLKELRMRRVSRQEFLSSFVEIAYDLKGLGFLYYMFDRFNNSTAKGGQVAPIYNPDEKITKKNYNIEHFLAQTPRLPIEEALRDKINNIGNLLIVSRHTNSTLGNEPPEEKIKILKNAKHSQSLVFVQDFIDKYADRAADWGVNSIQERAKEMAELAYDTIWHF